MSWYEDLTAKPQAPATPPQRPAGGPNWYEDLTGRPQELTQGGPSRPQPIGDDLATAASPLAAGRASMAPDVPGQIKLLSQSMNIPEDRFGVVDGNIVYADAKGNLQRAIPSVFKGGVGETIARAAPLMASQVGPMLSGAVGGLVGTAMGPTGMSVPVTMGTTAITDMARQALANKMIGRSVIGDIDPLNAAGQALMSGAGQLAGVGVSKLASKNPMAIESYDRATAMDPARQAQTAALEAEAKRRGIDLTAGQATGMRSLLTRERQLSRFPETADQMYETAQLQRGTQVPAAIRNELDSISPVRGEAAVKGFTGAAEDIAQAKMTERSAQARVAYGKALDTKDPYFDDDLKALMKRPSMKDAWAQAQRLAKEEGVDLPKFMEIGPEGEIIVTKAPDWRSWDYMKRGLDSVIEANTNEFGRVNSVGRAVSNTKKEMLGILDSVNPEYAAARSQYGQASDAVDAILNGGIGFVRGMDGPARQSMVTRVFSGQNLMPEEVGRMRQAFLLSGKIDDWNAATASFLDDALSKATKETAQGAAVGNVPGKFRSSVWGDERQRAIVKEALGDPTKIASFEKLMDVLQAASRSLPEGSPTATDLGQMGAGATVGRGMKLLGKATSPGTAMNLGNEIVEGVAALREPAARQKLATALLSGDYAKQLSQLRMLPPTGEKALALTGQILAQAGVIGLGGRTPTDFAPSSTGATQ